MKKPKVSFLISAHNEEKIIGITLKNLLKLPYSDYEVIIGLDGCTDRTEEIVKSFCDRSERFKYFVLNLREGKPAVINSIIKEAKGEIIIINDADWVFDVKNKEGFERLISVFEDSKIGGIAESFPIDWDLEKIKKGNLGYRLVADSSYFWLEFQKERFTNEIGGLLYLNTPTMFVTNIFRKELYKENSSLGDDFERTYDIMNQGKKIVMFNDINLPRMVAVYNWILISDLFRQKIRTAVARGQIKGEQNINFVNYYFPAVEYILRKGFGRGFSEGVLMFYWVALTSLATLVSRFSRMNTQEGWKLRARS